jgi:hypothetical protein
MKENRLAPASPAVAEMAPQQPIQRGKNHYFTLYMACFLFNEVKLYIWLVS